MNPRALSVQEEIKLITEQFRRCFSPAELEQRARKIGFIQRKRKMNAQDFISLCVFQKDNIITNTLSNLCSLLDNSTKVSMSAEGLNQRFNLLGSTFLQSLFSSLLQDKIITAASLPCSFGDFTRIRIMDSTVFQLSDDYLAYYEGCGGSANESGLKIQLECELKSGEFYTWILEMGKIQII